MKIRYLGLVLVVLLQTGGVAWAGQTARQIGSAEENSGQSKADTKYFKMLLNKDDKLCLHVREVLTQDFLEFGDGYHSAKFRAPIFTAIAWQKVGQYPKWDDRNPEFDYFGELARFDIDNDGRIDIVVREEAYQARVMYTRLLIMDPAQFKESPKKRKELIRQSKGWVDLNVTDLFPFIFENRTYLLSSAAPDARLGKGHYGVMSYAGGKVGDVLGEEGRDEIEHICGLVKW